jgi:regulator of protease activity HflC (stomatin/prohibitin superfamily)
MEGFIWLFVVIVIAAALAARYIFRSIIVYEFEKALKYHKGRFVKILQPGKYWYSRISSSIVKVDIRPRIVTIPGQEIISMDGITLKVSGSEL